MSKDVGISGVLNIRFNKSVSDEKVKLIIEMIYSQFEDDINGMNWFEFKDGLQGSYDFKDWIDSYKELRED